MVPKTLQQTLAKDSAPGTDSQQLFDAGSWVGRCLPHHSAPAFGTLGLVGAGRLAEGWSDAVRVSIIAACGKANLSSLSADPLDRFAFSLPLSEVLVHSRPR